MRKISKSSIVQLEKRAKGFIVPISVDTICPYCLKRVNFNIEWPSLIDEEVAYSRSRCSGCGKRPKFMLFDLPQGDGNDKIGDFYISPAPDIREVKEDITRVEEFSVGLQKAYSSAINVFNIGEWTATTVLCRRLLEGIMKKLLPEEEQNKPLAKQLEILPKYVELQKPIILLGDAIRKGGNLGAHFDLEKEPDKLTATLMLELLDDLIDYLFILPRRINELRQRIESMPSVERSDSHTA